MEGMMAVWLQSWIEAWISHGWTYELKDGWMDE